MPRKTPPITYETVKRIGLALPEVVESTSYGTPALKIRDRLMVRLKEDGRTVVLHTTWEERERLMAVYPATFFITEHYRNYPKVLAHLEAASRPVLEQAIRNAWLAAAPKAVLKRHGIV